MKAFEIVLGLYGAVYVALGITYALRSRRHRQVPEPLRTIINDFSMLSPEQFRQNIDALHSAVMDLAAELGACPSCGSDPDEHQPPTQYPRVLRTSRGAGHNGRGISALYCGVCGVEAIEQPTRFETDWSALYRTGDEI